MLLEGPRGSGLTTLAMHAAMLSESPFVRVLAPSQALSPKRCWQAE